jgi:hypothetical protein
VKSIRDLSEKYPQFDDRKPATPAPVHARKPFVIPERFFPALAWTLTFVVLLAWGLTTPRPDLATRTIEATMEATRRYRAEQGSYPSGDGTGSRDLAWALAQPGRDGKPYLDPKIAPTDAFGNLTVPGGQVIFYEHIPKPGSLRFLTSGPAGSLTLGTSAP